MSTSNLASQRIPLKTAYNVRSLGGYPSVYGNRTSDSFLRGDCLCTMDAQDVDTLVELGVHTVIDLRGEDERLKIPDAFATCEAVCYLPIALMADVEENKPSFTEGEFSMAQVYIGLLENAQQRILAVFEALLEADEKGIVLFHCTAGKDRTGLIAALLLGLAGVESDWIVQDYALTGKYLQPVRQLLAEASGMQNYPAPLRDILLGCEGDNMEKTLVYLQEKYGGAREFLRHIGLQDTQCDALLAQLRKGNEEA